MTHSLAELFSSSNTISYGKNQILIHAADTPPGVYFVQKGFVKKYLILENGKELTFRIDGAGSIFPLIWTFTDTPNDFFFQTLSPTKLLRVDRDAFVSKLNQDASLMYHLLQYLLMREEELFNNIAYQQSGDSSRRIASILVLAAQRFGKRLPQGQVKILLPLTHQEIASLSGLTRESASIALGLLTKQHLITKTNDHLVVNDLDALRAKTDLT